MLPRTSVIGWPGLAVYVRGTTVASSSGGHSGWSRVLVTGKSTFVARRCLVAWRTLQADGRRRQAASHAIARRSRSTAFRSWHLAAACCSTALVQGKPAGSRTSAPQFHRMASSGDFESATVHVAEIFARRRGRRPRKEFVPALCVWRALTEARRCVGAGVWPIKRTRNKEAFLHW